MVEYPEIKVKNFLKTHISDPNPSRPTNDSYIYPDEPILSMSKQHYPRLQLQLLDQPGIPKGLNHGYEQRTLLFQLDLYVHSGQPLTYDGDIASDTKLRDIMAEDIINKLQDNSLELDSGELKLKNYRLISCSNGLTEEISRERKRYRKIIRFSFQRFRFKQ